MMKKSNKKGFTLVELIVVIAIMAILAAVLVPTITNKIKDANESSAKSSVSALAESIRADIITASTTTDKTFQGEYFAVKVTEGTTPEVEIGEKGETFVAATDALDLETNNNIKVENLADGTIKVYHADYTTWYYIIDHTGKITIGPTA